MHQNFSIWGVQSPKEKLGTLGGGRGSSIRYRHHNGSECEMCGGVGADKFCHASSISCRLPTNYAMNSPAKRRREIRNEDDPDTQRFSSRFEFMAPEFFWRTVVATTRTWPQRSDCCPFSAAPSSEPDLTRFRRGKRDRNHVKSSPSTDQFDFSALPIDIVARIGASFTLPNLRSASLVCRSWRDALQPLREAMLLLKFGKRFKHGRGGYKRNLDKAFDCFLKGAKLGSALAMVDAGLMLWEAGRRDEAISLYEKAADLGDPAGQCNLGVSHLLAQPSNPQAAVKWLYRSSLRGCPRAQYQLALCLHQGLGVEPNFKEAAKWYLEAAEGGYVRAMYNTSICYSSGEGFHLNRYNARRWMKRAAERGHSKAQFDHGLALFSS